MPATRNELMAVFIEKMTRILQSKGKTVIGFECGDERKKDFDSFFSDHTQKTQRKKMKVYHNYNDFICCTSIALEMKIIPWLIAYMESYAKI